MTTDRTIWVDELSARDVAYQRIRALGIPARREVFALGRYIDLSIQLNGDIFTIEFKSRDWRRALSQAIDHKLVADYAYICMPRRELSSEFQSFLLESGVGLMFWNPTAIWPLKTIISAPRSTDTWIAAQLNFIRNFGREAALAQDCPVNV